MAGCAAALMGVLVPAFAASNTDRFGAASRSQVTAPKNEDVLPALLAEVRGLRAAMEQMASVGPRVQLFVSRLQLQEARMNTMIRRLDSVRENLASEQRESDNAQEAQKRMETALASGTEPARDELAQRLAQLKRDVADHKAAVVRLIAEEAQLTQDLAVEQGRWTDINQRLDELERALSKR
jgi:hypothetical protein